MGYSFWLATMVLLYASSHRQDNTYHILCYTSPGALAGMRNTSMGPPWRIDPTKHCTMSERFYHGAISRPPNTSWRTWHNRDISYTVMHCQSHIYPLEWEIAQRVCQKWLIWRPIATWVNALTMVLHLPQWVHQVWLIWRPIVPSVGATSRSPDRSMPAGLNLVSYRSERDVAPW